MNSVPVTLDGIDHNKWDDRGVTFLAAGQDRSRQSRTCDAASVPGEAGCPQNRVKRNTDHISTNPPDQSAGVHQGLSFPQPTPTEIPVAKIHDHGPAALLSALHDHMTEIPLDGHGRVTTASPAANQAEAAAAAGWGLTSPATSGNCTTKPDRTAVSTGSKALPPSVRLKETVSRDF